MKFSRPLVALFLVVFLDLVGFGIVIPILPYYAKEFGASAFQLGWLMAIYSMMQFLVAPIWGRLSDFVGRKKVIQVSLVGSICSLLVLGFAKSLEWVFIGRLLAGISAANISVAYAFVADITTEENRAKGMGMIGAGFGLGFIFGPAIGGTLSHFGYAAPMFFAAGLTTLNLIFAARRLEEPNFTPAERASRRSSRFSREAWLSAWNSAHSRKAILLFFLVTTAVTQMEVSFALFMKARFNLGAQAAGGLLAILGLLMAIVQGGLVGRLARKFGETRLVWMGALICGSALFLFGSAGSVAAVGVALGALAAGNGLIQPSLSTLASLGAAPDRRGAVMGVFHSAGSLARVVGPPCAGWLFDRVQISSPFFAGSLMLSVVFALALSWDSQKRSLTAQKA